MNLSLSLLIIFTLLLALMILGYFLHRKMSELVRLRETDMTGDVLRNVMDLMKITKDELSSTRQEMQGNLTKSRESMETQMRESHKAMHERLDNAARVIMGVNTELGNMKEIGRSMKELQDFLRSPKLRGNIGEQVLVDLLSQYFSRDHFHVQYKFRDGSIVDAAIVTDKGMIPVDSKFPMENFIKMTQSENEADKDASMHEFGKDVKKHITDISKKYILPSEGTVDFAIMYVPSEAVYYEIIRHSVDLHQFAYEKRVFPVSPNSFYYFLKVIMIALEGKKIEAAAAKILETLDAIRISNEKFGQNLGLVSTHLNNAKNACDKVNTEYSRLTGQIENVRLLK
ncbi:MAG: Uncharacterized protein G01um101418_513 [Parcubacteria group bacterium Gr01-1014_18]|nr:MAG: Uncharacterized protein Greene041636_559 [Parcubacteria group bacterium Greene0416_36]TSC80976.1 MAG: Uncharacterized protein G01um101418_513 [Parcubacteria group bacterium Gr01-1014_18]TSC98863.1 MAG: Uncharacterized protein Greene101420_496 [Parcubacteria group bacterium Greene1014_20]TSD06551.1 MAG: Uncharacterized protein Greene07142_826 [Parcubacteria group bacterium Greene0714_2]